MNSLNNISSEEWNLIETWLDQISVSGKEPLLNEKLTQIPNFANSKLCPKGRIHKKNQGRD